MFDAAVNNLAVRGRLVVIGFISGYQARTRRGGCAIV
jgi:NADPH-dependent curcumin reductase CurA